MVNLVTVPAVELMKTGTWNTLTGEWNVTPELIQAAIAAHQAAVLRKPVIRVGHNDPRFTGDPAVGYIDNVRASVDGNTLLGDMVGVPEWLGDIMASAYPDRSIEGLYDYTAPDGTEHPFVLTGVALLGATAPGVSTLKSLQDVARMYDIAAAGQIGGTAVELVIRAATDKPKPYGDVEYADTKNNKYPIDTEAHCRAAWAYINMPKNQKDYSDSELAAIKAKIRAAAKKFGIEIAAASAAPQKGGAVVASLKETLAQRLGLKADADEADVVKAFEDKWPEPPDEGHAAETAPQATETPVPEPVSASAPNVVALQKDQYDVLMAAAAEVNKIRAEQAAETRNNLVAAAIGDGRITPASRNDWLHALEVDPGGHNKAALASLAPGLVPVSEIGHALASEATDSEQADKERMLALITGRKDA